MSIRGNWSIVARRRSRAWVPFVKQPGAPVYTRASFAVEAGNPGLQQVDINAVQGTRVSSTAIESDAKRIEAQEEAGLKGGKGRRDR